MEHLQHILEIIRNNTLLLTIMLWFSVATFILSAIAIPLIIKRLPRDFFIRERSKSDKHPVIRLITSILRVVCGTVLITLGIAMLALPGQGIIALVVGISVMPLPYKRRLEHALISGRSTRSLLNRLRRFTGEKEFIFPE